ncbi:SEC10/PgrA surface exclusion domain-containing protein [Lactobacillus sp. ESL0791]|uniref:SEC10/PgrA surface exclusion domain-containing protein n=1 Tax=Lactobacillus sp. ESL0791 TaxID=2983234 RepID=UPI0023F7DB30|nr:SEC10/PgrA surface exclusion domain-containing protein [Lactobacillus sp. ESL0791]MDF7639914.1 SEC10/PgrA surface exclusion domain-containing protein [Lactobacillus sp. ESL0791]
MNLKNKRSVLVSSATIASILSGLVLTDSMQTAQAAKINTTQTVKAAVRTAKVTKRAYLYNKHGKLVNKKALEKNKKIKVHGTKIIKGKMFYNIGHGEYVPVTRVKLAKNAKITKTAALYNHEGKKIGNKILKKGKKVIVYGTKTIKGKKYYFLGNGKYILAKNAVIRKKTVTSNHNDNGTVKPGNSSGGSSPSGDSSNLGNSSGGNSSSGDSSNLGNSSGGNSSSGGSYNPGSSSGDSSSSGGSSNNDTDTSTVHDDAVMILPKEYTREALYKAYNSGYPIAENVDPNFINACKQGVRINNFDRSKAIDQAGDDTTIVDPTHLTPDQQTELSTFALRLINQARACLNLHPWIQSTGTQQLANDIADEYHKDNHTINEDHDVEGIIRASKKNGLNIDGQYIEDLAAWGYSSNGSTMTMSQLKKHVYLGIKQCLFGFTPSSGYDLIYPDSEIDKSQNYSEWRHAGDLLSAGENYGYDSFRNYFALSISTSPSSYGKEFDAHFISVSSYLINGDYGQKNHCTFDPGKDPTTNTVIVVPNAGDEIAQEFSITDLRKEFIKALNQKRTTSGLAPVTEDPALDLEAQNIADKGLGTQVYTREVPNQLLRGGGSGLNFQFSPDPATTANDLINTWGNLMDSNITTVGLGATVQPNGSLYCYFLTN